MKKFLIKIFLFALCLLAIDQVFGFAMRQYEAHRSHAVVSHEENLADSVQADLIVFGSSHALNHYNTDLMSDSLGFSCFNAGIPGMGCITNYGFLVLVTQRYKPKYVILDIMPWFDSLLDSGDDVTRYLGPLKPFYDRPDIPEIFKKCSWQEAAKMHSWFFRYNTRIVDIPEARKNLIGYSLEQGLIDPNITVSEPSCELETDSVKTHYLQQIIRLCKSNGIKVALFVSPWYKKTKTFEIDYIREMAKKENVPFVTYLTDTTFVNNYNYFYSADHMNETGANAYSRAIIPVIRELFDID